MQTQALKDSAPAVDNPWVYITWEQPYAKCDEEVVLNPSYRDKFKIEGTLPEPFTGDIRSNVVCLNGNPGDIDTKCTDLEVFFNETRATLNHSTDYFMWLSDRLGETEHSGCKWWKNRTKELRMTLGNDMPKLFVLEFFPYHSKNMFKFPALPSDAYRNFLLNKAIEDKKLIVIMRAGSRWYDIKEGGLGKKLKEYENKIVLQSPRNVSLSKKNLGEANWNKFIEALQSPTR